MAEPGRRSWRRPCPGSGLQGSLSKGPHATLFSENFCYTRKLILRPLPTFGFCPVS